MSKRAFKTELAHYKNPLRGDSPMQKKKKKERETERERKENHKKKERKIIITKRILQIENISLMVK